MTADGRCGKKTLQDHFQKEEGLIRPDLDARMRMVVKQTACRTCTIPLHGPLWKFPLETWATESQ